MHRNWDANKENKGIGEKINKETKKTEEQRKKIFQ